MSDAPFQPNWTSPPIDTIYDILKDKGMTLAELGTVVNRVDDIAKGGFINLSQARQLSKALGASVEFWMIRDFQYQTDSGNL